MTFCYSFPPAGSSDPLIMILGSMPGVVSISKNQYYGHPQNSLWKIMGDLFGAYRELPYEERLKILAENRITLWETLHSCVRPGSSDSDISKKIPNDFNAFFKNHPNVNHLFFDGTTAYKIFKKMIAPSLHRQDIGTTLLPSTSPRNALMNYQQKLEAWKIVKTSLRN